MKRGVLGTVLFLAGFAAGCAFVKVALPPAGVDAVVGPPAAAPPMEPPVAPARLTEDSGDVGESGIGAVPDGINRATRDVLEELMALGSGAPGEPNPALIDRMSELLQTSDEARRTLHFSLLLEAMRVEDAPAVAEVFAGLKRQGLEFHQEAGFFAQRWGELDPDGALAYVVDGDRFERGGVLLDRVMVGWASRDPAEAADWLTYQPDGRLKDVAIQGTATGWARTDYRGATGFVLGLPEGEAKQRSATGVFWQVLYQHGLSAATSWFESLPEDQSAVRAGILPLLAARKLGTGKAGEQAWVEEWTAEPAP